MSEWYKGKWPRVRLGDHTTVKARLGWKGLKAGEYVHEGPIFLAAPNLRRGCIDFDNVDHIPQWRYDESPEIRLKEGDVLLVKDGSTLGISSLVRWLPGQTTVNGSIAVIRSNPSLNSAYLFYCINGRDFQRLVWLKRAGLGVPHLFQRDLREFKISFPRQAEQRRIAEILSTVDEAIEQTATLIAKYQQIKAGLMHDLFTRGVTPDGHLRLTREQAPHLYKESPLGWIPREWEVKPLGVQAEIVSGVTLGSKSEISDGVGVPYLRVANVQDGYFDLKEVKTIHVSRLQFEKLQLKFGDVLMNEGGDFDKLGRGSVWQEEIKPCIHQNHVFRVRPRDGELRSHFLAFWSQSGMGKKYFVMSSKQSTNLASINSTQLNRFPVALPSSVEQERIEERIMALNGHVDSLGQELAKLRQQKHGLMQDLLTGRVRVKVTEGEEKL